VLHNIVNSSRAGNSGAADAVRGCALSHLIKKGLFLIPSFVPVHMVGQRGRHLRGGRI